MVSLDSVVCRASACAASVRGRKVAHPPSGQGPRLTFLGACPYAARGRRPDHGQVTLQRTVANTALCLVLTEAAASLVAGIASELTWHQLLEGFVVSNTVLGLSLVLAGYPVARARPDNVVGWLLVGGGVAYTSSGVGYALLAWATEPGESAGAWRAVADVTSICWPLAVTVFVPLALLFFPDGHLHGPRWRWVPPAILVSALCFELVVAFGARDTTSALGVHGYMRLRWVDGSASWIFPGAATLFYSALGACLASLVLHYRRGTEQRRRQVLWLLLAAIVLVATFLVSDLAHLEGPLSILAPAFVPAAIAVAILRHQLLDIRLVVSRSLLYLGMTGLVIAGYVGIVAGTERALADRIPMGPPVLAAMAIAMGFTPVRKVLQVRIDRAFYGLRHDPIRAVTQIGSGLTQTGLPGELEALCRSLRLPWATIEVQGQLVAAHGHSTGPAHVVPLSVGDVTGRLAVGLRRGESTIGRKDRDLIGLVIGSLSVAVQATQMAAQLESARNALVTAREEERRRLGRDLHDGLGPTLTGVGLLGDAARRMVATDPSAADALLAEVGLQTAAAIQEIRRLAQELRPPALDSLGLVGALEQHSTMLGSLDVHVYGVLPPLPAAVEVAAYRVATEALTNVIRHSSATSAEVCFDSSDSHLRLLVTDNGPPASTPWVEGTGLTSMRERAGELGGAILAGPGLHGGRVELTLPRGAGR